MKQKCFIERKEIINKELVCFPFQHLTSVFLLHGFDTLELFSDLNKTDLDELEIKNPEERAKLLTAAQMLWDYEGTSSTF